MRLTTAWNPNCSDRLDDHIVNLDFIKTLITKAREWKLEREEPPRGLCKGDNYKLVSVVYSSRNEDLR